MTIISEFRVSGEGIALGPALQAAPGMTLELERTLSSDGIVHFLWASGGDFAAFEAALPDDPTALDFEIVEDTGESRLYRVTVSRTETVDVSHHDQAVGASRLSLACSADGLDKRVRFPDRAAMSEYFERIRGEGFDVQLQRVYRTNDRATGDRWGLSEKQYAALSRALADGYYEVPRRTDLASVAEQLGVSRQATSERLRRGTLRVLQQTLGKE